MSAPHSPRPMEPELRNAFHELMAMHDLARLTEAGLLRVLKTIPPALLWRALAEARRAAGE